MAFRIDDSVTEGQAKNGLDFVVVDVPATYQSVTVANDAIDEFNANVIGGEPWSSSVEWVSNAWGTPDGVVLAVGSLDYELAAKLFDQVGNALAKLGLQGTISWLRTVTFPSLAPHNGGYTAGVRLIGEPVWEADGGPGRRLLTQTMWEPSSDALHESVQLAVDWCRVGDENLALLDSVARPLGRKDASLVALRQLEATGFCQIGACDGTRLQRRVSLHNNGYQTLDIGGSERPPWAECVTELTNYLEQVHQLIDWGCVVYLPEGAAGIGARTPYGLHDAFWLEMDLSRTVRPLGRSQDPRNHSTTVLDVYGVQVLGAEHDLAQVDRAQWNVRPLGGGRSLVHSYDLDRWFAGAPSVETLVAARESFGDLLDPSWAPEK